MSSSKFSHGVEDKVEDNGEHKGKGELHIFIGPMFSGKTTALISFANRNKSIGKKVLVINHVSNDRFGGDSKIISSHDKRTMDKCLSSSLLLPISQTDDYLEADIILIEESQFFNKENDLYDFVKTAIDIDNKIVAVAGLDGDIERSSFGETLKLIPLADSVKKMKSYCEKCGNRTSAPFTQLRHNIKMNDSDNNNKVLVGDSKEYIALCRKHYINYPVER